MLGNWYNFLFNAFDPAGFAELYDLRRAADDGG
jgi:hypothetical protein